MELWLLPCEVLAVNTFVAIGEVRRGRRLGPHCATSSARISAGSIVSATNCQITASILSNARIEIFRCVAANLAPTQLSTKDAAILAGSERQRCALSPRACPRWPAAVPPSANR